MIDDLVFTDGRGLRVRRWANLLLGCWLATVAGCRDDPSASRSDGTNATASSSADVDHRSAGSGGTTLSPAAVQSVPFAAQQPASGDLLFETLDAADVGMEFQHQWTRRPGQLRNNTTGSGVAMGDYDGDGRVDVFLPRSTDGGRLFRNLGGFRFEDVTEQAGLRDDDRWTTGATFADIDNDGDLDLYVCGFDCPNHLYLNNGDGTFSECAKQRGLDFSGSSVMMAFGDYDRDGDLDAYLVTNHVPPDEEIEYSLRVDRKGVPHVPRQYLEYHDTIRLPDGSYGVVEVGQYDHLYENLGDGTFLDVSRDAGVAGNYKGLAATWWDYNHDGWPDLYVANDFYGPDHLYRNNRDGTFTDVAAEALPHTPWFSMGCDLGDVNNDGLFDLIGTDMAADTRYRANVTLSHIEQERWFLESPTPRQYMRNMLYLSTGTKHVTEAAYLAGLEATNWTWSVRMEDLDQDGWTDVYFTNGMSLDETNNDLKAEAMKLGPEGSDAYNDYWETKGPLRERNLAFRNRGNLQFENVSREWGLDYLGVSFGAAFGDLDGDGDLDLVVNNFNDGVSIYRNSGTTGHAIRVRLVGNASNRWGIGATLKAHVGGEIISRYHTLSRGFMSASDPTVHIGLGHARTVDRLEIEWPSGARQELRNLPADQLVTITEPPGPARKDEPAKVDTVRPLFARSTSSVSVTHREKPFDDLGRQPLLSWRHSRLGPGMAVGDVDADGRDDIFVGGAAKDWGTMLFNRGGREWAPPDALFPVWNESSASEDMGALLLDVDGDDDLDLYVVSGGVECEPGDELLRDRLYLNDGGGVFVQAAADRLPDLRDSGSVAAAADYDRDGDLDLFVGGRVIPGQFPVSPKSRLLNNHEGTYRDATIDDTLDDTLDGGPELLETGMVTAAVWSDVNDDGWLDLLVTHEWGPIKLFLNHEGRLSDATRQAGLADKLGWWNSIAGRDLDGDGDIDYVAANLGRNTPYRATAERPARLFFGDFTGTGRKHVLEANDDEQGQLVPVQTKPIVQEAMAMVEVAFPTYHDYAVATLADIVGDEALQNALQFSANTVDSVILRNDGRGVFAVEPLPVAAQLAPGYGLVMSDFDADGFTDVYLAQNSYAPRGEIGHFDGGLSVLLRGNAQGQLVETPPLKSGLVVPGDAKSVVATDVNGDGWPDILVAVNNGATVVFENQGVANRQLAALRLRGQAGNPTAIGARVTLVRADGLRQTAEVVAGSGYLSQQPATLWFGLGSDSEKASVEIRWPDGQSSTHEPSDWGSVVTIRQPAPPR